MDEEGYVLLVEDHPGDARLTLALLQEPGGFDPPAVRWVQTIAAAVRTLETASDCLAVLLDLGLPDSEGFNGLLAIAPLAADCPVVVLTGNGNEALGNAAVAAGAQDFLTKGSFDAGALRRCLRYATQRKRSARREIDRHRQAALADAVAARDLLRDVLTRVGDGFVALDLDWRYIYVNDQAVQLLGRQTPQDLLGRHVFDEFPDLAGMQLGRACRQAMATQQPMVVEELYAPWNRWFENRLYPSPKGLTLYFSDTTERNRAAQELRKTEAYLRSLFEQLSDGVLLLDRVDHRVLDANPQALSMLQYSRDELLALSLYDLLPEADRYRIAIEEPQLLAGQRQLVEWEHVRKDGSRFPVEVSARALDARRYVKVLRDITARRQSEQALLAFQFELSQLTQRLLRQERDTTQRIAQALHDHLGQTLAVARLNLDACIATHAAAMPPALQAQSARIAGLLDQAVREVRQVLADLRPALLEDQGLAAALDNEVRSRQLAAAGADVLLEVTDPTDGCRWPDDVEYALLMIAREAITNALLHAGATLVRVLLAGDLGSVQLDVVDDGTGIPLPMLRGRPGHLGLVGMRERTIAIGARFSVTREPAGGTRVTVRWEAQAP